MVGLFLRSSQHQAALLAEWGWEMKHGHAASRVATNRIQARGMANPGNGHVYRAKWREHCPARRVSAWALDSRDIDCVSSKSMVRIIKCRICRYYYHKLMWLKKGTIFICSCRLGISITARLEIAIG